MEIITKVATEDGKFVERYQHDDIITKVATEDGKFVERYQHDDTKSTVT